MAAESTARLPQVERIIAVRWERGHQDAGEVGAKLASIGH
jgi:hypothetical protein